MTNRKHDQIQWVPSGDPNTVDTPRNQYPGQLGGVYTDAGPATDPFLGSQTGRPGSTKQFRFIQTDSGMSVAPAPGMVAFWKDRTKFICTTDPTNRGYIAGVFPAFDNTGKLVPVKLAGNYGFIVRGGRTYVKLIDTPTAQPDATGKNVIPSATAGKADVIAAGTAPGYPVLGRAVDTLWPGGNSGASQALALVDLAIPDEDD
jgi:hypothetical protein